MRDFVGTVVLPGVLVLLSLMLLPSLPPSDVECESVVFDHEVHFEGGLEVNDALDSAKPVASRVDGGEFIHLKGAESFAAKDGFLYSGIHGGEIIRLDLSKPHSPWRKVVKMGLKCSEQHEEAACGRPLGMDFGPDGDLVVADPYYGIYSVDVDNKKILGVLVPPMQEIDGRVNKLINSVAVAKNGTIFYTVSSTAFELSEGMLDLLAKGSGRVMAYDPATKSSRVLVEGVAFANGIALDPNENFVVFCEGSRQRLWKLHGGGGEGKTLKTLLAHTPGVCDNVKANGRGAFLVGIVAPKPPGPRFDPMRDYVLPYPFVSRLLLRLTYAVKRVPQLISRHVVSLPLLDRVAYWTANFESFMAATPKYGLVVEYDSTGKALRSWHSPSGNVRHICEAFPYEGHLYLGSPWNEFVRKIEYN